jgi:S-formylglutathione hydrolase FrmB
LNPRGRVVRLPVESRVLRGNALGDPHVRELPLWLPPDYDEEPARRYPVAFYLAGYLGIGESQLAWRPWGETIAQRLDRLTAEGRLGPIIVALPDCFTKLGGSQYIDSPGTGRYMTHLCEELVPLVDRSLRTRAAREHRAVLGKSSGGFGAIVHAMLRPETWGAAAVHSGDAGFEFCFLADLPKTLDELARHRSVAAFMEDFWGRRKHSSVQTHAMMHLAMAACFDPRPEPKDGLVLPLDPWSGRVIEERWQRWLDWDPVRMIPRHRDALARLRYLHIDCGSKDQYRLHYGARQMHQALRDAGLAHDYEEFPDDHSQVEYRLDVSLPRIYDAIGPAVG